MKTHHDGRHITRVVTSRLTTDGAGVRLRRSLGIPALPELDPFLLLDEFKSDDPNEYIAGFPDHPHRGFETVTYMLEGSVDHEDNLGNKGTIKAGGIQWMTAGRGIVHSEMPLRENGRLWGFQLWVNLPSQKKMSEPRYRNFDRNEIPELNCSNGCKIRVIAGKAYGTEGSVAGIAVDSLVLDVFLRWPGEGATHPRRV